MDRAGVDAVEVRFSGGLLTGVTGPFCGCNTSPSVGGSFPARTSLRVMAWCAASPGPRACSLSFRSSAGSASTDEEEREVREERSRSGSSSTLNF